MRYIDSGIRDATEALGTWLGAELLGPGTVKALRVQTGFFSADAMGYFENALLELKHHDGHTRILIGSNDGVTPRSDLAAMLAVVGAPRSNSRIGVVSYQRGYFHPKVFHVERTDGTHTAYVGSANLTGAGVTSLHVEAGLILDTAKSDPQSVLDKIAHSIDDWFTPPRAGLYEVAVDTDLAPLVRDQVIDVSSPPRATRTASTTASGTGSSKRSSLSSLVATPPLQNQPLPQNAAPSGTVSGQPLSSPTPVPVPAQPITEHWAKPLSASDADRKPGSASTARGAIPLGQGRRRGQIDASQYFRHQMFGRLTWLNTVTRTGEPYEETTAPIHVTIERAYHGVLDFRVSHDPRRQQGTRNLPTTQLHTSPIAEVLRKLDVTGMELTLDKDDNDDYWLTIT